MYAGRGRRDYTNTKRVAGVQNSHAHWANSGVAHEEDQQLVKRKAKAAASKAYREMEEACAGMYADADEGAGAAGADALDPSPAEATTSESHSDVKCVVLDDAVDDAVAGEDAMMK